MRFDILNGVRAPSSSARSSFWPAPSAAMTMSTCLETPANTMQPYFCARAAACFRVPPISAPVKTIRFPFKSTFFVLLPSVGAIEVVKVATRTEEISLTGAGIKKRFLFFSILFRTYLARRHLLWRLRECHPIRPQLRCSDLKAKRRKCC